MLAKQIYIYPNPILRQKTQDLSLEKIKSAEVKKLVASMFKLMYQANGVGLAAPQVGLNWRLAVVDTRDGRAPQVFINPYIISTSFRKLSEAEGCLSLPGLTALVKRPRQITVKYFDQSGQSQVLPADPFLSRVLQHEIDHLDGVLLIDRSARFTAGNDLLELWEQNQQPALDLAYPYTY